MMQAIVFNSMVDNGYIPVPEEYKDKIYSSVKVIVLTDDKQTPVATNAKSPQFSEFVKKWAGAFKVSDDRQP